jgi:hypothetical protein
MIGETIGYGRVHTFPPNTTFQSFIPASVDYKFYYRGNTLYWVENGKIEEDVNWIKPKDIAMDKITKIVYAPDNRLEIYTLRQTWVLYYGGTAEKDWYVSGPFMLGDRNMKSMPNIPIGNKLSQDDMKDIQNKYGVENEYGKNKIIDEGFFPTPKIITNNTIGDYANKCYKETMEKR